MNADERRKNHRDNQNYFSEKISDLCRYTTFGVVAVYFTLISQDGAAIEAIRESSQVSFDRSVFFASLAIFADLLQFSFGFIGSTLAANNTAGEYRRTRLSWVFYYIQNALFYLKQVFSILAVGIIIYVFSTYYG